ncbi:MAG: hypothetical protein IJ164_04325 [Duodenibacillus sp.]|nr:hypothetical protein [Duodenibacillus sp.]
MSDESNSGTENANQVPAAASQPGAQDSSTQPAAPAAGQSLFSSAEGDKVDNPTGGSGQQEPEKSPAQEGQQQSQEAKSEEPKGAPEKYDDFSVPEGYELDKGVSEAFKGVAKELGLTQENAQAVITKMTPALAQMQVEQINEISQGFVNRTMSDPEIGGTKWQTAQRDVARIRDMFGKGPDGKMDPDVEEFLNSPIGNHPGVLKLFARAGRAFGEGGFPQGRSERGGDKIDPSDMYPRTRKY